MDARLLHPSDPQDRSAYPLVTRRLRVHAPACHVCRTYRQREAKENGLAELIVLNSAVAPCHPCFMCASCFDSLHRRADGTLVREAGDIEVLPLKKIAYAATG